VSKGCSTAAAAQAVTTATAAIWVILAVVLVVVISCLRGDALMGGWLMRELSENALRSV
jgi:hypothetical protein